LDKGEKGSGKRERRSGYRGSNGFEVRVLQTRYGVKVLVRQGDNRVWLNERQLGILFQALMARIFSGEAGGHASGIRGRKAENGENDI